MRKMKVMTVVIGMIVIPEVTVVTVCIVETVRTIDQGSFCRVQLAT